MTALARSCTSCQTPLPEEAHFCLHCGAATPTEPGVPPRTGSTEIGEVARVRNALAEQYQVERILGEGGMATVYLAQDLKHRRKVAIKVMRPEMAATLPARSGSSGKSTLRPSSPTPTSFRSTTPATPAASSIT